MNAPQLWQELGNTYLKLGAVDRAVQAYSKLVEPFGSDRERAQGWRAVADLYLELNEPNLAADAFLQAARLFVSPIAVDEEPHQAAPAADAPLTEASAPDAVETEQTDAGQLPLGIPGYETIEPVATLVEMQVAEDVLESHPGQLVLGFNVAEETSNASVLEAEQAQPLNTLTDEVAVPGEVCNESRAWVDDAPVEMPAPMEEPVAELNDAPILTESAPQLELVAEASLEPMASDESAQAPSTAETTVVAVVSDQSVESVAESVAPAMEEVVVVEAVAETESVADAAESVVPVTEEVAVVEAVAETESVVDAAESVVLVTEEVAMVEAVAETESVADAAESVVLVTEEVAVVEAVAETESVVDAAESVVLVTEEVAVVEAAAETESVESVAAIQPTEMEEGEAESGESPAPEVFAVPVDEIVPNPYIVLRTVGMEEQVELIQREGLTHPLIVTPKVWNNKYLLLVGEWRLEAARRAGLQAVPVLVRDVNPREFLEVTLLQNAQQTYLNPLEVAQLYQFLTQDFGLTCEAIADKVGRSPLAVENTLRLLNLTEEARKALNEHVISEDHAQALLCLPTADLQDDALIAIVEQELSIQRTIDYVAEINARTEQKPAVEIIVENVNAPDADVAWLQDNQPVVSAEPEATGAEASTDAVVAEDSALPVSVNLPTTIVEAQPAEPEESGEPMHKADETFDNEGGYPVALPGTLADIRKNVLMAWKLESEPFVGVRVPTLSMNAQAGGYSDVAVMSQVERLSTARTILVPDTHAIISDLSEQALAEAVEEVVIPVETVVEVAPVAEANTAVIPAGTPATVEPVGDAPSDGGTPVAPPAPARTAEEEAVAVYKRVTELNPTNDRAWHMLGNLLLDLGRLDEAVSALQVAISLNASRDIYYYHLGIAQAVQKSYTDAVQSFEKALALNPENIFAHCSIIGYYRKLGREGEAEKHFKIVAPNIQLEKAYNRACFESICGNTDAALDLLRQAIAQDHVPVKWVERDPDLDLLRDDPRYKALIESARAA